MGWFSRIVRKVVEPVIEHVIEPVIEHVIEPVITAPIKFATSLFGSFFETVFFSPMKFMTSFFGSIFETVVEPIITGLGATVDKIVNAVSDGASTVLDAVIEAAVKYVPAVALDALEYLIDNIYDHKDIDVSKFAPVDGAEIKQHETILQADWTQEETITVRDAVALTQVAFADFTELFASDVMAIDAQGYVIDEAALYAYEDWHTGIEGWVQDRYDIIRVQEATLDPLYEVNVSLFQSYETGDYTIAFGGTDGTNDVITDIGLTFFGDTFGTNKATAIIEDFFANDIVGGEAANVTLMGASLGGAEALQQYRVNPHYFDEVVLAVSAGLGGLEGVYYDRNLWDGTGDAKITEINENDGETGFNDFVTSLGFIGAGQTYELPEVVTSQEFPSTSPIDEFSVSHLNYNLWASLPGGEYPDLPDPMPVETTEDAFVFV